MHLDGRRGHHNEMKRSEGASLKRKPRAIVLLWWCGLVRGVLHCLFAQQVHSLGQGLLGLKNTRREERACRGKKERKKSSLSLLVVGICSDRVSSSNLRRKSSYCISLNAHRSCLDWTISSLCMYIISIIIVSSCNSTPHSRNPIDVIFNLHVLVFYPPITSLATSLF